MNMEKEFKKDQVLSEGRIEPRQGKCVFCFKHYIWPAKIRPLSKAVCPKCFRPLHRTSCLLKGYETIILESIPEYVAAER